MRTIISNCVPCPFKRPKTPQEREITLLEDWDREIYERILHSPKTRCEPSMPGDVWCDGVRYRDRIRWEPR